MPKKSGDKTDNIERLIQDKNVQFRNFASYSVETRKDDDEKEELVLVGQPAVFNQRTFLFKDWDGYDIYEEIDEHAFDDADMDDVIFNYNHAGRVFARSRKGKGNLALSVDDKALNMEAKLWADDEGHRQLHRDIDRGIIDKMSYAYTTRKTSWTEDEETKTAVRRILEIEKLYDVSAVDIPAYDATTISARHAITPERKELRSERQKAESRKGEGEKRIMAMKEKLIKIKTGG